MSARVLKTKGGFSSHAVALTSQVMQRIREMQF